MLAVNVFFSCMYVIFRLQVEFFLLENIGSTGALAMKWIDASRTASSYMEYTDASSLLPKCIHVLAIVESLDAVYGIAVESDLSGKCMPSLEYRLHTWVQPCLCGTATRSILLQFLSLFQFLSMLSMIRL